MKISFEKEAHHYGFDMMTIDLTHYKLMFSKCVSFVSITFCYQRIITTLKGERDSVVRTHNKTD